QDDYRLKVNLEKQDLGFVRLGYEQFRKYYDDSGGVYSPLFTQPLWVNPDFYVYVGGARVDRRAPLAHFARVRVAVRHMFQEGDKSSLAWSDVLSPTATTGVNPVSIFPAYKDLREHTHIVKLDVSHEIYGVHIEDSFRAEFYDLNTRRVENDLITLGMPTDSA